MTHQPNQPENSEPAQETLTGAPRWVKVSAIVAGILLLVVVAVMLLSGGQHGPARIRTGRARLISRCTAKLRQRAGVNPGWS